MKNIVSFIRMIGIALIMGLMFALSVDSLITRKNAYASERIDSIARADTVMVISSTEYGYGGGTGFLLADHGHLFIVTNRHVCETVGKDRTTFTIVHNKDQYQATLIAKSTSTDLCVIQAPPAFADTLTPLRLAAREPVMNEPLTIYGHPFLQPLKKQSVLNKGVDIEPLQPGENFDTPMLRIGHIDTIVAPGNSGSPVLNLIGEVEGVIFAYGQYQLGLYIPLNDLRAFLVAVEDGDQ